MATKLEKLLQKEAQLKAQIQQALAAERALEKKRDTRRKILIGAAVMARVERGEWPQSDFLRMMDGFLSRPHERVLFGLDGDGGAGDEGDESVTADSGKKAAADVKKAARRRAGKRLPEPSAFDDEFDL